MSIEEWKSFSDIVNNFVTAGGIVVGGAWILWKFGIQREAHPKIEFDLELNILGHQGNSVILDIVAKVTNKGLVRHWLRDFHFDLLYLPKDALIQMDEQHANGQILFEPHLKKRYWIPESWSATFIDPSVCQRYSYVTYIPDTAGHLLVLARFKYPDQTSEFHTAQKVWLMPSLLASEPI